jgi:hypothetical protein
MQIKYFEDSLRLTIITGRFRTETIKHEKLSNLLF